MTRQIGGLILVLTLCALLVALTHFNTKDKIADNQRLAQQAQIRALLPDQELPATLHWKQQQLALCMNTAVNRITTIGYGGDIVLLVAFAQHTISGVRVVSHQETPGLGDFIDTSKAAWMFVFANQPTAELHNSIDQVTGATITRNAIVEGVLAAVAIGEWSCT